MSTASNIFIMKRAAAIPGQTGGLTWRILHQGFLNNKQMKRQLILLVFILSGSGLFGQFGAPRLESPVIEGNSVTIRFRAPKAIKVQLNGDFLPVRKLKPTSGQ
jgi:hypothetical protein